VPQCPIAGDANGHGLAIPREKEGKKSTYESPACNSRTLHGKPRNLLSLQQKAVFITDMPVV